MNKPKLLNNMTPEDGEEFAEQHSLPKLLSYNPLSNPKGVTHNCEICARESHLQCSLCTRTYYCCQEHQEMDWRSIHCKVCPFVNVLRAPPPVLSTQEQRSIYEEMETNTKKHILFICKAEAQRHLNENNPELAHPAGLQALRYAADIFGPTALELVPPYLLLAEANIAAELFDKAQEHLCQAKWILLQHPECDPKLKSQHSRNFGKLCLSTKKYDKALRHFSQDVYFTALVRGPEHIHTSIGLYLLGIVFIEKSDTESAVALFEKVLSIWTPFLQACIKPVFEDGKVTLPDDWDSSTAKMGHQILKKIVASQKEIHGSAQIAVAQALFAEGLLNCVSGDWSNAFKLLVQANQMFEVTAGSEHSLTRESHKYLQLSQKMKSAAANEEFDDMQ
jgi:tetratricopeptide (TPR) repeat protein